MEDSASFCYLIYVWSLYQFLDYCLTIRGTPGIESALFGAQTIVCGTGRYENRGFVKYFDNKKKYLNYLLKLKKPPKKNNKVIQKALLYAENVIFKKTLKLASISVIFKKNKSAEMDLKIKFKYKNEFCNNTDVIKITEWLKSNKQEFYLDN